MTTMGSYFMIADIENKTIGLPVSKLHCVVFQRELRILPVVKPFVDGYFILDESPVFVVNLSKYIGEAVSATEAQQEIRNVVMRIEDGFCAIPVFSVPEIVDLSGYPAKADCKPFFCVATFRMRSIHLVDPELLFVESD